MPEEPFSLLSPKIDFVFKKIFGDAENTRPLASFLQAALSLPDEEFTKLAIIDPHVNPEYGGDKLCIFDVRAETSSGRKLDVEIQTNPMRDMCNRLQYYTARMVAGQVQEGEGYGGLAQSITIVVADFLMWPGNAQYHHRFRLYESDARVAYPNSIEIHTLELPKIPVDSDESALCNWLRFVSSRSRKEFEALAGKDEVMAEAYATLKVLSADEKERLRAEYREKAIRDEIARQEWAEEEGRRKGLEKGLEKGIQEGEAKSKRSIAREMLKDGMPVEGIARWTGLSVTEIGQLTEEE